MVSLSDLAVFTLIGYALWIQARMSMRLYYRDAGIHHKLLIAQMAVDFWVAFF